MSVDHPVRRATPEDAAACARVVSDWVRGTDWIPNRFTVGEFEEMFRAGIPIREFYVVGEPVKGYLSLNRETAQVMGLYVARPGAGLGKALMDAAKDGRDYLQLRSHEPNTEAHRFYEREGFEVVERGLTDGDDGVAEIRMEWRR